MLSHDQPHKSNKHKKTKGSRIVWKYAQADFERANELLSDIVVYDLENNIDLAWSSWIAKFMDVMKECKNVSTKF